MARGVFARGIDFSRCPGHAAALTSSAEVIESWELGDPRKAWHELTRFRDELRNTRAVAQDHLFRLRQLFRNRCWEQVIYDNGKPVFQSFEDFCARLLHTDPIEVLQRFQGLCGGDAPLEMLPALQPETQERFRVAMTYGEADVLPDALKATQLEMLQGLLPAGSEVRQMLDAWAEIDQRYWGADLTPCWMSAAIEPYGKCIGSWSPSTRTLNLVPRLFQTKDPTAAVQGVLAHECAHQAQGQLYRHLDQAKGPRGRWTDFSHRCPSWSRAVEDVIQRDGINAFCPVWHRSTGNIWRPWVPAASDWMTWKRVEPDATFDGRPLLGLEGARSFAPGIDLMELVLEMYPDECLEDLGDLAL